MCGIAGKVVCDRRAPLDPAVVREMTRALAHRGPDDEGVWSDEGIALGSRRLAVVDLSPRGHQPMESEDGNLHLVFNGEIYNFQALRAELERSGCTFRSRTDTEVILKLFEREGVRCLRRLRGMFAFAVWESSSRTLTIARDRLGKKPLFYAASPAGLSFASEAGALLRDTGVRARPDPVAIDEYLTFGCVAGSRSAFDGVRKLPPAHYLVFRDGALTVERYWSLRYSPQRTGSEEEFAAELLSKLEEAVRLRLISDVPLGALLSGGVDSTAVVALMRRVSSGQVRTFSIGSDQREYDELPYAREVARRFETEHHELTVRPDPASTPERVAAAYSEPFADSSAVPSLELCAMARQFVTVALNGDGGDESFAGYDRYAAAMAAARTDRLPAPVRSAVARAGSLLPSRATKAMTSRARRFLETVSMAPARRYARWLAVVPDHAKQRLYTAEFSESTRGVDPAGLIELAWRRSDASTAAERAMAADVALYLPDDLLVKMDIASMAHSLEVRSPLLDHEVVEYAASLPLEMKMRGRVRKYLLKRALGSALPSRVARRRKMGFAVPIDHWLRHELRDAARDVLCDRTARQRGYFRPDGVERLLDEHASGAFNHQAIIWSLLMLELWHRRYIDSPRSIAGPVADVAAGRIG